MKAEVGRMEHANAVMCTVDARTLVRVDLPLRDGPQVLRDLTCSSDIFCINLTTSDSVNHDLLVRSIRIPLAVQPLCSPNERL